MLRAISRKSFAAIALELLAGAVLVLGATRAGASPGTSINPGSTSMLVGGTGVTTAVVTLAPIDTIDAFDITIAFTPAITTVVAGSVTAAGGWTLIPPPTIDNTTGTLRVIGAHVPAPCPVSPCPLFSVTWLGVSPGVSPLTLVGDPNQVLARSGAFVTAAYVPGSVTVTAPALPTATFTPTATPTKRPGAGGVAPIFGGAIPTMAADRPTATPTATPVTATPTRTPTPAASVAATLPPAPTQTPQPIAPPPPTAIAPASVVPLPPNTGAAAAAPDSPLRAWYTVAAIVLALSGAGLALASRRR